MVATLIGEPGEHDREAEDIEGRALLESAQAGNLDTVGHVGSGIAAIIRTGIRSGDSFPVNSAFVSVRAPEITKVPGGYIFN